MSGTPSSHDAGYIVVGGHKPLPSESCGSPKSGGEFECVASYYFFGQRLFGPDNEVVSVVGETAYNEKTGITSYRFPPFSPTGFVFSQKSGSGFDSRRPHRCAQALLTSLPASASPVRTLSYHNLRGERFCR